MLGAARYLADFARFVALKRPQERHDADALRDHYDDFFRPLDAPMGFTTNVNLAKVPDEIAAVSKEFRVAALSLGD
jgi:hypothetical protein